MNAKKCCKNQVFPENQGDFDSPKNLVLMRKMNLFLGKKAVFGKIFGEFEGLGLQEDLQMRKKNFKGRCEKRVIDKCSEVCRTYDAIQYAYADVLQKEDEIREIRCNVLLDGLEEGEYTSDFVCVRADSDLMVRECVYRKYLTKPLTVRLLDASREYWLKHGVSDWGLVIDEEA